MTGVHVYWTKPQFVDDKINYFYHSTNSEKNFTFNKFTTILSALWWKKLNGPIKLFTDKKGLELYKFHQLDTLYDEIDTQTLEKYQGNPKLWTSGKIYTFGIQKPPFCFLDNDLVIRQEINKNDFNNDIGFTHWELPRGSEYEVTGDYLFSKGIKSNLSLDFNNLVTNTSFFYINNLEFQKILLKEHLLNYQLPSKNIDTPIWMYTDQIIPGQIISTLGSSYFTLDNRLHIPYSSEMKNNYDEFIGIDYNVFKRLTEIPTWVLPVNSNIKKYEYEHVWVFKKDIIKNDVSYTEYISRYSKEIKSIFPKMSFLCE